MRMRIAAINFQLSINGAAEPIVRNHAADGTFHQQFGMSRTSRADVLRFVPADEARKTHVSFLFFLLAAEANLVGVDYDDEIAGIDMGSEDRFFFPAQKVCSFDGDAAEGLITRVDDPPLARNVGGFG